MSSPSREMHRPTFDSISAVQITLLRLAKRNVTVWAGDEVGPSNRSDIELLLMLKLLEPSVAGFRVTAAGTEVLRRVDEASYRMATEIATACFRIRQWHQFLCGSATGTCSTADLRHAIGLLRHSLEASETEATAFGEIDLQDHLILRRETLEAVMPFVLRAEAREHVGDQSVDE